MLEVLNKIDLLEPEQRRGLLARDPRAGAVAVSALTGAGVPTLLQAFEAMVTRDNITLTSSWTPPMAALWPSPIAMPRC